MIRVFCVFWCIVGSSRRYLALSGVHFATCFYVVFCRSLHKRHPRDPADLHRSPEGLPRGPKEPKMSPRRAPKGGPRDPKGPPGDPQRAPQGTRRTKPHQRRSQHSLLGLPEALLGPGGSPARKNTSDASSRGVKTFMNA